MIFLRIIQSEYYSKRPLNIGSLKGVAWLHEWCHLKSFNSLVADIYCIGFEFPPFPFCRNSFCTFSEYIYFGYAESFFIKGICKAYSENNFTVHWAHKSQVWGSIRTLLDTPQDNFGMLETKIKIILCLTVCLPHYKAACPACHTRPRSHMW